MMDIKTGVPTLVGNKTFNNPSEHGSALSATFRSVSYGGQPVDFYLKNKRKKIGRDFC